jgi:Sulfotransferase family
MSAFLQRAAGRLRAAPGRNAAGARGAPVVIFGTGGSGTRALQVLTDRAGHFMGTNLNRPGDSLDIGQFMRRWLNRYLVESSWVERMWRASGKGGFGHPRTMAADFQATIEDHRAAMDDPEAPWGWKAPRTILMFPFVHEMYPAMRAVHLVRDGRDMAYSRNQNQVRAHGRKLLAKADRELPPPLTSVIFWARVNLAAANYGTRFLGANYLRLRYEDVCADPGGAASELVDFLRCPVSRDEMREIAAEVVHASASIGRWKERDPAEIAELERVGGEALRAFGYSRT